MKLKELVIDRSKWLRGEGSHKSALLRPEDKKMCCLGFLAISCGAKAYQIRNVGAPAQQPAVKWPQGILDGGMNSRITVDLMKINDYGTRSQVTRERRIQILFKELGYKVKFVEHIDVKKALSKKAVAKGIG